MSSTVVKHLVVIALSFLTLTWAPTAAAETANTEAAAVARLYKDFAWQAMASQADLFGEDLAHQSRPVLEKYFTPSLADLLRKDVACQVKSQGICNLESDLLFNAQDPMVTDLVVEKTAPGRVVVAFKNPANQATTKIEFKLARMAGRWRIADIVYSDGSLRRTLSNKIL